VLLNVLVGEDIRVAAGVEEDSYEVAIDFAEDDDRGRDVG
jgi:hypothetical protein